jgi:glycosyltransferase involved in cell wall biosynthesis
MSKPICVFQSPALTNSGYGRWALEVAKYLLKSDKYDLKLVATRWGNCSKKNLAEDITDETEKVLLTKILRDPLPRQPELYIQSTIPNEFQPVGKYNIGMTAGIETTVARGEWIEGINRMDMTICTSQHAKDVFAAANYIKNHPDGRKEELKVTKPMEVCFWGADTKIFKKTNEECPAVDEVLNKCPEEFAFLFVGQWTSQGTYGDRKDIGMLIKTFLEAFRGYANKPCLVLKTSGATQSMIDKHECLARIKEVLSSVEGDVPNVYLLHGELTDVEMNYLYNHRKIKAHVNFTHGEGYGHPLLLATLSGKPLLVSQWSGHLDFLNPEYSNYLKGDLVDLPPHSVNDWLIKESKWFQVNYEAAKEKMRHVFSNYESYLDKAEKLREENSKLFCLDEMGKQLDKIFNKYVPQFAIEKPLVLPTLKKISLPKLNKPPGV